MLDSLEAARKAGWEVVEQGAIGEETQVVLDRPLVEDPAVYANMANASWESRGIQMIGSDGGRPRRTPSEAVPLPPPQSADTMRDLVAGMAVSLDPQEAKDLEAVIEFRVDEDEPGTYYLDIAGGR